MNEDLIKSDYDCLSRDELLELYKLACKSVLKEQVALIQYKDNLVKILTERRESAIEASLKFRGMPDRKEAYTISNSRCNLYDEIIELIEKL